MESELLPPLLEIARKRLRFIAAFERKPVRITMHPRVWMDVVRDPDFPRYGCYRPGSKFMDMEVIEDPDAPGIAMILE